MFRIELDRYVEALIMAEHAIKHWNNNREDGSRIKLMSKMGVENGEPFFLIVGIYEHEGGEEDY